MIGSGALPLPRETCEAAIRRGGRGAEASLRGFAAGHEIAAGTRALPREPAAVARATELQEIVDLGVARLRDFQGVITSYSIHYTKLYEEFDVVAHEGFHDDVRAFSARSAGGVRTGFRV